MDTGESSTIGSSSREVNYDISDEPFKPLTYTGMVRIIPDLSIRCKIPWEKQQEMTLADMCIEPDKPWEYCPREVFRRVVNVAFEIEFDLLKSVIKDGIEEWFPIDKTSYCSASLQAETGKGQFEVVLGYTEAGTAITNLIYARQVIKSTARQHGLYATFVAKYAEDEDGSGSHVHISLSRNGENVFMASGDSKYGMSKVGEYSWLGYEHMLPERNAAYICWGKENTEAPLRTTSPPGSAEDLVKCRIFIAFDACANSYLGLAAIIMYGVDGLRKDLSLQKPGIKGDSDVSGEDLRSVPDSIPDSLVALAEDTLFSEVMSENLLIAIKGIRKMEVKNYCQPERDYAHPGMELSIRIHLRTLSSNFIFKF
ncbi:unnamed protein product [Withania somnifera]